MTSSIEAQTERFGLLPEDAQKAIQNFDYDSALKGLHTQYKLHIDQAAALEQIVADIVFGDRKAQELIPEIQKELRVTQEQALAIAVDVNHKVLVPIQQNMRAIQAESEV